MLLFISVLVYHNTFFKSKYVFFIFFHLNFYFWQFHIWVMYLHSLHSSFSFLPAPSVALPFLFCNRKPDVLACSCNPCILEGRGRKITANLRLVWDTVWGLSCKYKNKEPVDRNPCQRIWAFLTWAPGASLFMWANLCQHDCVYSSLPPETDSYSICSK